MTFAGWIRTGRLGTGHLVRATGTLASLLAMVPAHGQWVGPSFTHEQAVSGQAAYEAGCASCHGETLDGGELGPPLRGRLFLQQWGGKSVAGLFSEIAATKPSSAPGTLGESAYAELTAYILQENGVRPSAGALPSDLQALGSLVVPSYGRTASGGLPGGAFLPPPPDPRPNPLDDITPVTDEMLTDPPQEDWLTWRRTNDAFGYSPLDEINRVNVGELRVAWSWSLPPGSAEVAPLVHDGVMFVHGHGDIVQALDAATGDMLWQYSHWARGGRSPSVKRSIGLGGERVYLPTSDGRIVALDVRTGEVVWDQQVSDDERYAMTAGPLVAQGMVMIGTTGRAPGGNYIVGLDAATGEEMWRWWTIARPGEPGGESWNGLLLEERNGGSIWVPGTYDAEVGLAFFGVAQTYDTGPLLEPLRGPGVTSDALFTNTTVALDPDTGELVWYYQHLPNDQWDLDWIFGRQVLTLPVDGVDTKVVATAGKVAIYDFLEAETGAYVDSLDLGLQDLITAIDPETGAKTIDPAMMPGPNHVVTVCPHAGGAKNWIPGSYDAASGTMFLPLTEFCMDLTPGPEGTVTSLSSGVNWTVRPRADSDGNYGRLQAVSFETGEVLWTYRQRTPWMSGVLATAGGVVFGGDVERYFTAFDTQSGEQLWQVRLSDVPNSPPISYAVDGKQYVALTAGHGGGISVDRTPLIPEVRLPSSSGPVVWVFELPDR